ncbi:MAG: adenylosuccinate lyase, partial [Xanthomonadaceae bacterium]|nr:adenylosuccinate lyase [Xanthomonadaceae bacterium]
MQLDSLTALSPLDGRYASKVDALRPIFSEYGLMRRRVAVEIAWLIALSDEPGIAELPPFPVAARTALRKIADDFSVVDAARVKQIETTTNHDVKAVEYFIK